MKNMTLNEYQQCAQRTSKTKSKKEKLDNGALGLSGEVGEVSDHIKKWLYQDAELDEEHIIKELGDVLWYICETAAAIGADLETVAAENVRKLRGRYPNGYEAERSVNRDKYMKTCGNCSHYLHDYEECVLRDIVRGYDDDACERFKL